MVTITDIKRIGLGYKVYTSNYITGLVFDDLEDMDEFCKFTGVKINHLKHKMEEAK